MLYGMHATFGMTDERAFQMQAKNPVSAACGPRSGDGRPHLFARIGYQGWQASSGAIATVSPSNRTHSIGRRLIIKEDAASPVDLQIYEARRQKNAGGQPGCRPIGRYFARAAQAQDTAHPDHHGGFEMPAMAVKNTVCNHGMAISH